MARPRKNGLDYFPHDCDALTDDKILALRSIYGLKGYGFYFAMLERIYRSPGCRLDLSNGNSIDVLSAFLGLTPEEFNSILKLCLSLHLFNERKYTLKRVIFSLGTERRKKAVTGKRENARISYSKRVSNAETTTETEEIKEKERKENQTTSNKTEKENQTTDRSVDVDINSLRRTNEPLHIATIMNSLQVKNVS
ncbi:MAG: DUF4373 domain-containing protein [bacterium]